MKKLFGLFLIVVFSMGACKTTKKFAVKEEAVTVVNAGADDVAYKYYVILGSFQELNNAMNFSDELETKGFVAPVLLKSETGNYRVSVFSSDSESDARNKISSIMDIYDDYEDVWLLIKK